MKLNPKFLSVYYEDVEDFPDYDIEPEKTMLLIVDVQNEFALKDQYEAQEFKDQGTWPKYQDHYNRIENKVIPNSKRLLDYFREKGMPVSFGRIASLLKSGEDRSPVQKSEGWNGINLHVDSHRAQMVDELSPIEDEIVVNKTTDSVTTGTNYLQILRYMGITTVVVTGLVTDQCVASTVRGLADDGLQVITVEDATSTADIDLHNAELKIMNGIYTYVLSTDETLDLLESKF